MIRRAVLKSGYADALRAMPVMLVALLLSRSELEIWYAAVLATGMVWWGFASDRRGRIEMHRLTHDLCPSAGTTSAPARNTAPSAARPGARRNRCKRSRGMGAPPILC
jgi:hypothetical protein